MTRVIRGRCVLFVHRRGPCAARAQDAPATAKPTGLPAKVDWTFNLDAGWGSFGFANSLFDNPKEPGVTENLSNRWFEGYVKPALSGTYTFASSSQMYGKVSAVGERTYGSVPESIRHGRVVVRS